MTAISHGFNGTSDRLGRPLRRRAQQTWRVGATVNIGFIHGLRIIDRRAIDGEQTWILEAASGRRYGYIAHCGIFGL